ncbi:MAG: hypothetical protein IPO92_19115 [Saprospiraceae bacterium]|nr:hypothetical protein [Saprospiraceae bacterium]
MENKATWHFNAQKQLIRRIFIAWVIFLCCLHLKAQSVFFQSYTSAQGLSQNSIYSMAETPEGFMWFGTQDGINRFDGKNFVCIRPYMSQQKAQSANFSKMITALYYDLSDHLWVGTTKELLIYNRYLDSFYYPKQFYTGFFIPSNIWFKKIIEDNNDNIWVITQDDGVFCYSKVLKKMVEIQWVGEAQKKIGTIVKDFSGHLWLSTQSEMYQISETKLIPIGIKTILRKPNLTITDVSVVSNKIWIITNGSEIVLMDLDGKKDFKCTNFNHVFSGNKMLQDVRLIHQSDKNTVWVGSRSDGLIKIDLDKKTFVNAGSTGSAFALKSQFVLSFFTNRQFVTWVGLSGGGIAKYDKQKVQFEYWKSKAVTDDRSYDNMILSLFSDNDVDFYAGTLYGGLLHTNIKTNKFQYFQPPPNKYNKSDSKNIYNIIKTDEHNLWMATWGGLYSFDQKTNHFTQYTDPDDEQTKELTFVIKLKNQQKLLTGGYRGGLRIFDLNTKSWENCRDKNSFLKSYLLRVRFMEETNDGNILMSTEAQNLVKYNYLTGEFTRYPQLLAVSEIKMT